MSIRNTSILSSVTAAAVVAVFIACAAQGQTGPDAQVIAQLKKAGSNLSKAHRIEFYLYLPTRESADRAAARVRGLGCGVKRLDRAASGPGWLVLATKTMVPSESELVTLRKEFELLAKVEAGEYDGWEAEVVK